LSDAEVKKILATRAARNALRDGQEVLARIDSHLLSVTGERNPPVGLNYGVFGRNPESFAGVYRALVHSDAENARIAALPEDDPDRSLLFTPFLQQQTQEVLGHLRA
jgi:hypothetical protein